MPKKLIDELTDLVVRSAKPGQKDGAAVDRKLNDGRGLYLLVRANKGAPTKHWRLRFILDGKERLLALGEYPDVGLRAARDKAAEARELVRQGIDPVQHGRELRIERQEASKNTFEVVAEQWIAKRSGPKKWTEGHVEQIRQALRDYVYPKLGKRPIAALMPQDIMAVLNPLEDAGKLETLRRVRQRVGAVLAFAVQTGRRRDNPVAHMAGAHAAPTREHFASIKPAELPAFLQKLADYQGHPSTLGIIRMILWTACRTGEIRGATWDEFDLEAGRWTIPAERMKKRRPHVVPLPPQAVAMLEGLRSINTDRYAFASPNGIDQMPSENIVLQAIDKMGMKGRVTGHGLRAVVATALEELGYSTELVKAQLSHSKGSLTDAAYLRGVHIERRTEMMEAWANCLQAAPAGGGVVPIRRAA